ncbi:hypothetical protein [Streptomyces catenulae]|uniref:TetR family transcriptional regulator n=1 Tax=Streptomyces catenulae TaxID=66875 RepID=A0ABV2Z8P9_9ACTN|nr:hypothetical protein [Streptomyces catenulae]
MTTETGEQDATLAAFVGQRFATALYEGLRRARVPQRTALRSVATRPPDACPVSGGALLAAHAQGILAGFRDALAIVPGLAGQDRTWLRTGLLAWARQVLDAAACPERPVRRAGQRTGRTWPPALRGRLHALAVSLLIEAAVVALPGDVPATSEAIRTLARTVRSVALDAPV